MDDKHHKKYTLQDIKREGQILHRRMRSGNFHLVDEFDSIHQERHWSLESIKTGKRLNNPGLVNRVITEMANTGYLIKRPIGNWEFSARLNELLNLKTSAAEDTRFSCQHQRRTRKIIRDDEGLTRSVLVNETENALNWLGSRKDKNGNPVISENQVLAGERLRSDYTLAQMAPNVTQSWNPAADRQKRMSSLQDESLNDTEKVIAARQRVYAALEAVGVDLARMLLEVCCLSSGLAVAESRLGLPQRSGKIVLQIALSRLAQHYGLEKRDGVDDILRKSMIRSWGSEDYRPSI